MFQGFYNLASGVLTQTRKLNVISNNMVNVTTPGFKSDTYIQTTFKDVMMYRTGNADKSQTAIGDMNMIAAGAGNVTNYTQGGITSTASSLDFMLSGNGFFAVRSGGQTYYTRNGSFCLDNQGYLYLDGVGRVLGRNGRGIYLGTDRITSDSYGNLYNSDTQQYLGRIRVVDFNDYDTDLEKTTGDLFIATGNPRNVNTTVIQYAVEDSNVDAIQEMTDMITTERALQSVAQVQKMYDTLAGEIVKIGPA